MITINKYDLVSVTDLISGAKVAELINLPAGARVLSVGVQKDIICAWIIVDTEIEATNTVYVQFIGTNWQVRFPEDVPNPMFVDTVSLYNGDFAYHVFMGEVNTNWNVPVSPEQETELNTDNATPEQSN